MSRTGRAYYNYLNIYYNFCNAFFSFSTLLIFSHVKLGSSLPKCHLEEEEKNCGNILRIIRHFSHERIVKEGGNFYPISIQWRPAPMYIVPGSLDYAEKISTHISSWKCSNISPDNKTLINALEQVLSNIPYEFERPIPDEKVGKLMSQIQEADRTSKFAIGGLANHIINFLMESLILFYLS